MTSIRALDASDFDNWLDVYRFYAEHYKSDLTDDGISATWAWLMDAGHPLTGIVAEDKGQLIGLAHYRAMPSPLRGVNLGFLDDLVVKPQDQGSDAAKLLLGELKSIGKKAKWAKIRWITRDDNYRARALYDKVATKTD
ncbi:GNAT family N-acetyltransferase [Alphaproteobacteria bacterium]|nr:GNAT family N-acetyltransferase [Alphaproteobacteria bacterium]